MALKCSITEGRAYYHYETNEIKRKCKTCKKEFLKKRECCGQPTVEFIKTHLGSIHKDLKQWGCSCEYGSFHRFAKHWRDQPGVRCRHYKAALKKVNTWTIKH